MQNFFALTARPVTPFNLSFPTRGLLRRGAVLLLLAVGFGVSGHSALAETERVEVQGSKAQIIDVIAAYDGDSCASLLSGGDVRSQAKNGTITIESMRYKLEKGLCRGKTVNILVVRFGAKRGFRGMDKASISYKSPPTYYTQREVTSRRAKNYVITVK